MKNPISTQLAFAFVFHGSVAYATTVNVTVGIENEFRPDVIQANIGDVVQFLFMPTNHSVRTE
jgi:plastocyanin